MPYAYHIDEYAYKQTHVYAIVEKTVTEMLGERKKLQHIWGPNVRQTAWEKYRPIKTTALMDLNIFKTTLSFQDSLTLNTITAAPDSDATAPDPEQAQDIEK